MKIQQNINLKDYNTFHISSIAENLIIIENTAELHEIKSIFDSNDYFILGGGSNILLSKENYKNVISIDTKGIEIIKETVEFTDVRVAAGEIWHNFLEFLLENKLYGLENLALIPGKCGAAPIQNIGAYGVEQEQYFLKATIYNPSENKFIDINREDCQFDYRYSIFKSKTFKNFIITDVVYRLNKEFKPNLNYNELKKLDKNGLTPNYLFNYICDIRKAKIPYPEEVGNAGSFFKNPKVKSEKLQELIMLNPEMPHYNFGDGFKLSAGWLIEKVGMRGVSLNSTSDAKVSDRHSLILTNKGIATGGELVELSELIMKKVNDAFGVTLEREVNII